MPENTLLVASSNKGKVQELSYMLSDSGIKVLGLGDIPQGDQPPPEENGSTYCENAIIKASCWTERSGLPTLADDSGLAVDHLGGAPGIFSARFAGPDATDQDNNRLLLEKLSGVPESGRTAAFMCCIAVCRPGYPPLTFEGRVEGCILESPSGNMGFGYDPLFYHSPSGKTFAQLEPAEKNRISHRAKALDRFLYWLENNSLSK